MSEEAAVCIVTPCFLYCFCITHQVVHQTFFLQNLTCPNRKEFGVHKCNLTIACSIISRSATDSSLFKFAHRLLYSGSLVSSSGSSVFLYSKSSIGVFFGSVAFCLVVLHFVLFYFVLAEIVDWLHCSSLFCSDLCSCYKGIIIDQCF